MTLRELGERYILREIIPKYCDESGNDCAVIFSPTSHVVLTTDPVPTPAAKVIGGDPDLYWLGWLLVIINSSDLAAAGARPLAFLSALELEPDCPVEAFERLLEGTRDGCRAEGLRYVGGNLKEAKNLSAVGTAVGHCPATVALTRHGGAPGDILISIGGGGLFWRDAISTLRGRPVRDKHQSPLFAPRSQLGIMPKLNEAHLIRAAIDNSDGLLPSLSQLAASSSIRIILDLDTLQVPTAHDLGVDSARLWLGWGDWNVLAVVSEKHLEEVYRIGRESRVEIIVIGRCGRGNAGLFIERHGRVMSAPRLESERFAADSWFSQGIQAYVDQLLTVELLD